MKSVRMFSAALMFRGSVGRRRSVHNLTSTRPAVIRLRRCCLSTVKVPRCKRCRRFNKSRRKATCWPPVAPTPLPKRSPDRHPRDADERTVGHLESCGYPTRSRYSQGTPSYSQGSVQASPAHSPSGPSLGGSCNTCNQGINSGMYADSNVGYGDYGTRRPKLCRRRRAVAAELAVGAAGKFMPGLFTWAAIRPTRNGPRTKRATTQTS